ncbi:uncharacterized protein LOC111885482 isoform X3 [Lactuca sativa]|nr:uncharacterized protein LOC111885482 isoform X3 [Lactuca sativa]XP_023737506.1 uncharacterized protein LOC111885482 isoform X3 [Lactuca sativa]
MIVSCWGSTIVERICDLLEFDKVLKSSFSFYFSERKKGSHARMFDITKTPNRAIILISGTCKLECTGTGGISSKFRDMPEKMTTISDFSTDEVFRSLEDLKNWVQNIARSQGYVTVTKRSKAATFGFKSEIFLCCDRSGISRSKNAKTKKLIVHSN